MSWGAKVLDNGKIFKKSKTSWFLFEKSFDLDKKIGWYKSSQSLIIESLSMMENKDYLNKNIYEIARLSQKINM